jgi:hypothetical protein
MSTICPSIVAVRLENDVSRETFAGRSGWCSASVRSLEKGCDETAKKCHGFHGAAGAATDCLYVDPGFNPDI